jgi:flagellar protein FliO/FliZ
MNGPPDLALSTIKMVLSLVVVLGVIWGLYRVARKALPMTPAGGKGRMIQILESQYLGMKKSVTMVQVPGAVLVLGVSADKINLLTQIDNPEIIQGITDRSGQQRAVVSFRDQLRRMTHAKADRAPAAPSGPVTE